eukprot:5777346-Pleurochrysis_carterae.AAC.4
MPPFEAVPGEPGDAAREPGCDVAGDAERDAEVKKDSSSASESECTNCVSRQGVWIAAALLRTANTGSRSIGALASLDEA